MVRLYLISRSADAPKARRILQSNNVEFEEVDVEDSGILPTIHLDPRITKLPVVSDDGELIVGIKAIRERFAQPD